MGDIHIHGNPGSVRLASDVGSVAELEYWHQCSEV